LRRSARQPRHLRDAAGARGSGERTTISEEEVARREAGDALHAYREIRGPVAVHVAIEQREALERLPPQLAGGAELTGADVDEGLVAAKGIGRRSCSMKLKGERSIASARLSDT
jgi:hypothetical protein